MGKTENPKAEKPKAKRPKTPGSGRKPMFTDPAQVQALIDDYFKKCEGTLLTDPDTGRPLLDKWGQPVILGAKPPTVTGLALALGFTNRVSLLTYQKKDAFADIITKAKSRVEEYAETRLYDRDGAQGARFNLDCNFGWGKPKDEEGGGTPTVRIVCDIPRTPVESADGATQEGAADQTGVSDDGTSG